jgi:hypothetical protein
MTSIMMSIRRLNALKGIQFNSSASSKGRRNNVFNSFHIIPCSASSSSSLTASFSSNHGGNGAGRGSFRPKKSQYSKKSDLKRQQQPPSKFAFNKNQNRFPDPELRSHAVSVLDGDYRDHDDHDDGYKLDGTVYDKFDTSAFDPLKNPNDGNEDDKLDEEDKWIHDKGSQAYKEQMEDEAKRARWIENAKPPVRVPVIDASGRSYGKGGRKVSTARVWIYPGEGIVTVNRREFLNFFPRDSDREMILGPFVATKTCGMFDMTVQVEGGGVT